jgi:hypothetical protein
MFVWKKQSSHLTFLVAARLVAVAVSFVAVRFAGRLLCLVGTRAIKAPLACPHKAQRRGFPQIAEKTIPTHRRRGISRYLVTI